MDSATIVSREDVHGVAHASNGVWSKANFSKHSCSAFQKIKISVVTVVSFLKKKLNVHRNISLSITSSPPACQQIETMQPAASSVPNTKSEHIVVDIDHDLSPFIENLQKQELSKMLFTVSIPIMTGLILFHGEKSTPVVHFTLVGLSTGCTAIFNGLLLQTIYPRISSFTEQLGISIVLLSFYVQVGSYLPPHLRFAPVLCYSASVLPFAIAAMQQQGNNIGDNNDDGIMDTQRRSEVAENSSVIVVTECSLAQV